MSDDADLQAKIAAIAGRINRHKIATQEPQNSTVPPPHHYNNRYNPRWTPYARTRGTTFKNRSLVNEVAASPDSVTNLSDTTTPAAATFVKTRGINNQLMTQSTYQREQLAKQAQPSAIRPVQRPRMDNLLPRRPITASSTRTIDIDGLKFELKADGSKLTRRDDVPNSRETPRKAVIAGVEFLRTKNGNLLRKGPTKDTNRITEIQRPQCTCPFGPKCRYAHDPQKVAICKSFLRKGDCPSGEYCDLSHEPTYHRVPACLHFQKDACTNEDCRYPHVHTTPGAAVCRPFATLGYCDKGTDCDKRHVFECPDYANTGACPNLAKCPMTHVLRASTERAAAADSDSEIEDSAEALLINQSGGTQLADNEDYVALA